MIDVWNLGIDQFQGAFLSTGFLALELALFQQFLDDAGSLDGKKQDLTVAQSAKDDSATGPLKHHQFETPVDCTHDVAMYSMPASPHDKDVMHKPRGVSDVTASSDRAISTDFATLTCSEILSKILIRCVTWH